VAPPPTPKPTSTPTAKPPPTIAPTPAPPPLAGISCVASGATLDCDGRTSLDAQTFEWRFEDLANTTTATGVMSSHTYSNSGRKTVTLTVTGLGGTDSDTNQYDVIVP
jgi:hypothetical protein